MGTQMPSLRPLSTFSPSRTGAGTFSFVTTALPSAASVGASIVARIATVSSGRSGKSSHPTPKPKAMVSGSPIISMRCGIRKLRRRVARLALAESLKSTSARVSSASIRSPSPVTFRSSRPRTPGPARTPKARKTTAPLTGVRSRRLATTL
jgi:hypothetical protein